jgi:hypothetical protein
MHEAAAVLDAEARRLINRCIALGATCLDDPTNRDACCAAATPRCERSLDALEQARSEFESQARRACRRVPFRRVMDPMGLGFALMAEACERLDPPVLVENRKTLAECLGRILVEDAAHELALVEQPRALDALLCIDLAAAVPGVLRDDPATCVSDGSGPAPTATPAPTPTSGGPTPSGDGSTPTPTPPGGATPTPAGSSCSTVEVTLGTSYSATDIAGVQATLRYPGTVEMPGFENSPEVLARVTNLTGIGGGLFSVGDQDENPADLFLNVGLVAIGQTIPSGPFARARFDCAGQGQLAPSQFICTVKIANTAFEEVDSPCSVGVSVIP